MPNHSKLPKKQIEILTELSNVTPDFRGAISQLEKWICFVFPLVLALLVTSNLTGQVKAASGEDKIRPTIKVGNLFQICSGLAGDGVPLGLEGGTAMDAAAPKTITVPDGTLKEIMDSVVAQQPSYGWSVQDGVVNVYPVSERDDYVKSFLALPIKSFKSTGGGGRAEITSSLERLDEVSSFLNMQRIPRLSIIRKTNSSMKDSTSDINLSLTDVRRILNRIVRDSADSKFWFVTRGLDGGIFVAI